MGKVVKSCKTRCMWDVFLLMHFEFYQTQMILEINPDYLGGTQHCKSCSGLINIFRESLFTSVGCFQLCSCPACSSSPYPPELFVCFVHNIHILRYFFEPIPSFFLCVHVNVETTSVVELFSDRFSFSVKSGMWTDQCCPFRAVACAACVLLIISCTPSSSLSLSPEILLTSLPPH